MEGGLTMNRFKENSGKDNLARYKFFKNSDGDIAVKPCSKDANGYYSLIEEEHSLGFKQIVFTSGLLIKILLSLLYFHGFQINDIDFLEESKRQMGKEAEKAYKMGIISLSEDAFGKKEEIVAFYLLMIQSWIEKYNIDAISLKRDKEEIVLYIAGIVDVNNKVNKKTILGDITEITREYFSNL